MNSYKKKIIFFYLAMITTTFSNIAEARLEPTEEANAFLHFDVPELEIPRIVTLSGFTDLKNIKQYSLQAANSKDASKSLKEDNPLKEPKIKTVVAIKLSPFAPPLPDYEGQIAYIITTNEGERFLQYPYLVIRHRITAYSDEAVQKVKRAGEKSGMNIFSSAHEGQPDIQMGGDTASVKKMMELANLPAGHFPKDVFAFWVTVKIDDTNIKLYPEIHMIAIDDIQAFYYSEVERKTFN